MLLNSFPASGHFCCQLITLSFANSLVQDQDLKTVSPHLPLERFFLKS